MDIEGVDPTLLSDTLQSIGLEESTTGRVEVGLRKKPVDLCSFESEEREHCYAVLLLVYY